MDEKRIKIAESNFGSYLRDGVKLPITASCGDFFSIKRNLRKNRKRYLNSPTTKAM